MSHVPTYALYGERQEIDFLHCETIAARSRLHDYAIRPHRHEQLFQMLLLAGGRGEVLLDGARAELTPPCLVLVPPLVVHGYSFSNDVEGHVLTLHEPQLATILRSAPEAAVGLATARALPLAPHPSSARVVAASIEDAAREFAGHSAGRMGMIEAYLALACLAAYRVVLERPEAVAARPSRGAGHAARFREMIERDYRQHLPVDQYARQLGVTPVHLRRLCQAHLGVTPLQAINARLVLEARRQLVFTSLGVKEVGASLGFADDAYFTRFFGRETGQSPTRFRATRRTTGGADAAAPPPRPDATRPATGR